jgi:hypothetical protein
MSNNHFILHIMCLLFVAIIRCYQQSIISYLINTISEEKLNQTFKKIKIIIIIKNKIKNNLFFIYFLLSSKFANKFEPKSCPHYI